MFKAERELRNKLNVAFKSFTDKVDRQTNSKIEFEPPFRDLGFHGVPHRQATLLQPTSGCLISLIEWVCLCICLYQIHYKFHLIHFSLLSLLH